MTPLERIASVSATGSPRVPLPWHSETGRTDDSGRGLDPDEVAYVKKVARRLRSELRSLVNHLPESDRGGSRMSRRLGIDRSVCQRVLAALKPGVPDLEIPARVPGVQGLRAFVHAMRSDGAPGEAVDHAESAVQEYGKLVDETGGSQAALTRRIETTAPGDGDGDFEETLRSARESAFYAGVDLVGHAAETSVFVSAHNAVGGGMHLARLTGHYRFTSRRGATPMVFSFGAYSSDSTSDENALRNLDGSPVHGRGTDGILRGLSSDPVPIISSRQSQAKMLQIVDYDVSINQGPLDIFIAYKWAKPSVHPKEENPPVQESWAFMQHPARHLVFDTFVHKKFVRECIASSGVYLMQPDAAAYIGQRWMDQIVDTPDMRILPPDLRRCGTPYYPRQVELLERFFGELGWDPSEFVGHRCEVLYPIWSAGYCMTFDYTPVGE